MDEKEFDREYASRGVLDEYLALAYHMGVGFREECKKRDAIPAGIFHVIQEVSAVIRTLHDFLQDKPKDRRNDLTFTDFREADEEKYTEVRTEILAFMKHYWYRG